ncbi:SDR family NAD(P)-dependent oxidoreductase [Actinomycetospora straminea]|nr:SDR family NAD(P)-dependent oxidoreductase [Actinomycetospora straminea]MDD7936711.1 SDR family NAD(P)-dependent oxidoreductase [Actinomycetospora straminea]
MRILITGATCGLGLATARSLARRGAEVVVSGRDPAAVTRVAGEIGGIPVVLDLAHPEHVREVAAELPVLDAMIANAGVQFPGPPTFTADGVEETLAINVLGHVALIDALVTTPHPPAQVVLLGSGTHVPGLTALIPDPVEDLDLGALARGEMARASGPQRYSTSKLHTTALTGAYARAYPATHWTCYDPGLMPDTGLARARPAWQLGALRVLSAPLVALAPFAVSAEQSGATLASLVLNPTGPSGGVLDHRRGFGDRSARAADPAYQDGLLAAARELLAPAPV